MNAAAAQLVVGGYLIGMAAVLGFYIEGRNPKHWTKYGVWLFVMWFLWPVLFPVELVRLKLQKS